MQIYHYRSVKRALQEIKEGTLWAAKSETLNDPLEGYAQVVWKGDRIAWEGLLRNYIWSLYRCLILFELDDDIDSLLDNSAIFLGFDVVEDAPIWDILQRLADRFIHDEIVSRFVSFFEKNEECTADELCFMLRFLRPIAWNLCAEEYESQGNFLLSDYKNDNLDRDKLKEITSFLDDEEITEDKIKALESIANHITQIIEILQIINYDKNEMESQDKEKIRRARKWRTWQEILYNFPLKYVKGLEKLIYPDGFVVCFSVDCENSAMWGHYASDHKGVCLLYETVSKDGKETLPLKHKESKSLVEYSNFEVKCVKYRDMVLKRNFFETLGELNMLQIKKWLTNEDNEKSRYLTIYENKEWRKQYWNGFDEKYFTKMKDWEKEQEYRLVIPGVMLDNVSVMDAESTEEIEKKEPTGIVLEYAPDTLKGIVFGIRTNLHDKVKLLKAIKESGRDLKDFKVFEARYDERNRKIRVDENKIIKQFSDVLFNDDIKNK